MYDRSSSAKGHDQVGHIPEEKAEKQSPHHNFWCPEAFGSSKQFCHDIDDGPGGKRQEEDKQLRGTKDKTDHRSEKRRATSDESQQDDEFQGD